MKKVFLTLSIAFIALCNLQAQTEISGYLDSNPSDGISGAISDSYDFFQAVRACRNLVHDGKTDWYLPTYEEIVLFYDHDGSVTANGPIVTPTPGCIGTNCDWANGSGYWCWTRSYQPHYNSSNGNISPMAARHYYITPNFGAANDLSYSFNSGHKLFVRCVR